MASLMLMVSSTEEAFSMRTLVPMMPPFQGKSSNLVLVLIQPARTLQGFPFHVLARPDQTSSEWSVLTTMTLARYSGYW